MSGESHISSVIVHARPDTVADLSRHLLALSCEIVPTQGDASRLIVLIERSSTRAVAEALDAINALPGVYSALPVYHHAEQTAALAEPMPCP
ncbi:chaperone NapD [Niveispirillum fermenti]|uniref:chaperone NapD n=1 Tax=Niveispirillum fermenti TaxID=1233113 RepID=UPI003A890B42